MYNRYHSLRQIDLTTRADAGVPYKRESFNELFMQTFPQLRPSPHRYNWIEKTSLLIATDLCPLLRIWAATVLSEENLNLDVEIHLTETFHQSGEVIKGTVVAINEYDIQVCVEDEIVYRVRPSQVASINQKTQKSIDTIARQKSGLPSSVCLF